MAHPDSNKHFGVYFTKQWSDTFQVSFHNLLAVTFSCMPRPQLLAAFNEDKIKIEKLENDIQLLEQKLKEGGSISAVSQKPATSNYVKSMGIPGGLTENEPVIAQPQKKKLPFTFSTKKNPAPTSKPVKVPQAKQLPSTQNILTKASSSSESISSQMPTTSASQLDNGLTTRSKKLSGYQSQRRELLGGTTVAPKSKVTSAREDELSTSPVNQNFMHAKPPNPTPSVMDSPKSKRLANNYTTTPTATDSGDTPTYLLPQLPKSQPKSQPISIADMSTNNLIVNSHRVRNIPAVENSEPENSHILLSNDVYQEHHSAIVQCRFNNSGSMVASCDKDGVVKVWGYEPSSTTIATVMSRSPFLSLEWCKMKANLLLFGTSNGILRLYDTSTKQSEQDVNIASNYPCVTQIACNTTGNSFATSCVAQSIFSGWGSSDIGLSPVPGRLEIWNLRQSNAEIDRIMHESKDSDVKCISFNRNGNLLVSGDSNGILTVYDTRSYTPVLSKAAHGGHIYSLQFDAEENHVFTLGADGKFKAWDMHKLTEPILFPIHALAAGPFEVSGFGGYKQVHQPRGGRLFALEPDGRHVLTCDGDTALIYDVDLKNASLSKGLSLVGHRSPVLSVDWASALNCGHCLTGSMDGKMNVATLLNNNN